MKKAVVVGGSNGIGLAIATELMKENYYVYILDIVEPDCLSDVYCNSYTYIRCNLLYLDEELFVKLANDEDVELVMITAGFGRVAEFEWLHSSEIQNIIQVNTASSIRIIRCFYDRIKSSKRFYCGIMGSIAGFISSPLFSVYAASKAGICRFVESVNIELEVFGTKNRILNVSPSSIQGTRFNGGLNKPELVADLAKEITDRLFNSEEIYIPKYDETFKAVIDRYNKDPHEYGLHSYNYKMKSGRVCNKNCACIGYLSGTFDLFHIGHLNILERAKNHCDYLIVGVHPNARHKDKETFIPFEERKAIIGSIKYVDKVIESCPEDKDVWDLYHYNKLFVGSDYKGSERFNRYEEYFADKNVEIVYFPYTKSTSSTKIRKTIIDKTNDIDK